MFPTLLIIREMQIRTTRTYRLIPVTTATIERQKMFKRNHLCTIERNVNWYSHYGKQYEGSSKKLKTELVHDPALPLLHIYLKEITLLPQRDICTPMFTATLFTIATISISKYPLNTEWVKKT